MHLFDSDTLSHLWARHERVVHRLRRCEDTEIGTTSITKSEDLIRAQQRLDRSEQKLAELPVTPFDEAAGRALRQLEHIKTLKKIGRADLLIACIALANDATLVTRNLKHFRQVPNLKLENWVD